MQKIYTQVVRSTEGFVPFSAELTIADGRITDIAPWAEGMPEPIGYAVPGLIDAHVHIESSMLPPAEFGRWAAVSGTVATVSDPHEIANVLGVEGVYYMVEEARKSCIYHHIGAPSCVPATHYETTGAKLGLDETRIMLEDMDLPYLSEMMNWPGVLGQDAQVMAKINLAKKLGKPIDGHAPGLRGAQANAYAAMGISTDHECIAIDEAREKLDAGMKIIIRQGSAARNLEALHELVSEAPGRVMLCTDDCHPDTLLQGHINKLVATLVSKGHTLAAVLQAAHYTPKAHYNLPVGSLQVGDWADFMVLNTLDNWTPKQVFVKGKLVADSGVPAQTYFAAATPNFFLKRHVIPEELTLPAFAKNGLYPIIKAEDGQLITQHLQEVLPTNSHGCPSPDPATDTLLLAVANRYNPDALVATALIRGFGLKEGAVASSVAHDSHNVIAVGTSAKEVAAAINAVMDMQGGLALAHNGLLHTLALPIAGLMSPLPAPEVASQYQVLEEGVKKCGATPTATFMLLSFMALLVIPDLKLSDKGLFNGSEFRFYE